MERRTYSWVWRVRWKGAHACDKGLHTLPRGSGGGANTLVVRKAWRNDGSTLREARITWQMVEKTVKRLKEVDSPEQAENVGAENIPAPFLWKMGQTPPWRYRKGWWEGAPASLRSSVGADEGGSLQNPAHQISEIRLSERAERPTWKAGEQVRGALYVQRAMGTIT